MHASQKIKSIGKFLTVASIVASVFLSSQSCSKFVLYPGELTATAFANLSTVDAGSTPIPSKTSLPAISDPTERITETDAPDPTETLTPVPDTVTAEPPTELPSEIPTETTIPASNTPATNPAHSTSAPTVKPPILYYSRAGDTLPAVASRFGVLPGEITSPESIPPLGLLTPSTLLVIPDVLEETSPADELMPDSEIVFSPSAVDFNVRTYAFRADGFLSTYEESRSDGKYTGPELVERVGIENSVNPRLLLSLLELQAKWVTGKPSNLAETDYPLGYVQFKSQGLYHQLSWAVEQLNVGYYGWRSGILTELEFPDKTHLRISPGLNAGTVAIQYLFAQLYNPRDWASKLYSPNSITKLHEKMFGNPWIRAQSVEPLYPPNLTQPVMELPFLPGRKWSMTGGPHSAWGPNGALAALDFAPSADESGCVESTDWVTAPASGLVIRSGLGAVMIDLDGDGYEQTGWNILLMHIATKGRIAAGTRVKTDDRIGHPSCEGGVATGTHTHMARKYNGEWILADGPMPFDLSGWVCFRGNKLYQGGLQKGDEVIYASTYGSHESLVAREP